MANYQKNISYLDYLENGMKVKNAGFVRTEENNGRMRMEVRVKNLPETISGQFELRANSGGLLGQISFNRGVGSCCIVWQKGIEQGKTEVETDGIYIRLPGRRLVQTIWPTPLVVEVSAQEKAAGEEIETDNSGKPVSGGCEDSEDIPEVENFLAEPEKIADLGKPEETVVENTTEETVKTQVQEAAVKEEKELKIIGGVMAPQNQETEEKPIKSVNIKAEEESCYGDKWEQLCHMYPLVHPFEDERAYLSIAPKDFVVLCRKYQKMVHNSFLLHGYYNYHHLLLGKIQEGDEWEYYLGVPGNFYTREKMVAEMFGFEAFEGEKNPAAPGDFGYYMKRVEI